MSMTGEAKGSVTVIDDDPHVLKSISTLLSMVGYQVASYAGGEIALGALGGTPADVILTDVNMPGMSGIEFLENIRRTDTETPIIIMTGFPEFDVAVSAVKKGAYDFIIKPYNAQYLIHSVEKAVHYRHLKDIEKNYRRELEQTVIQRTAELADALSRLKSMSIETISRLTAAAELRDEDTGRHISRIGLYAELIARAMGMDDDFVETIRVASAMHDVGKIGVPDSILLKQGGLTPEEFDVMKRHTTVGERILRGSSFPMLQMAATIALNHHERWDGNGYPNGLRSEDIPIEGRIVMLVDQYDALRSLRVYKPAFTHEKALSIICEGDGRTMPEHFDPRVLAAFKSIAASFDTVFTSNRDS